MKTGKFFGITLALILAVWVFSSCKKKEAPESGQGLENVGEVKGGDSVRIPLIAWGADIITIHANGKSVKTIKNSLFDKAGFTIELFREDNFNKQVDMYLKGEIAFLRGTMGMINGVIEKLNGSPGTQPVLIFQHSWSAGGDALVVKPGIRSVADLRGKRIAIQKNGPHVDYLLKLLKDAQVKPTEVSIIWTRDLVGSRGDTPMSKFYNNDIDAAFLIIPDAKALTSQGTVGTGSEDSVKGARILLSTKTADRIISDVYAVRRDYFDKNREKVKEFVKALFIAEEQVRDLMSRKDSPDLKSLLSVSGKILLDDANAVEDIKGMYADASMAGFTGNLRFFVDANFPRNYRKLTSEIQDSLIMLGLLGQISSIGVANWEYEEFKSGLKYAQDIKVTKFDQGRASAVAEKLSGGGNALFSFEIYFKPNQNNFSVSQYRNDFDRIIDFASTYGGALITIEGHSDPMGFLRRKKEGADEVVLGKIRQAAKNLSYSRADSARSEIIRYAQSKGVHIDTSQFNIIGHGIDKPKFDIPQSEGEWQQNMRVQFKVLQVEAEEDVFRPLK
jgi:outer membrane protein OmpA-like peptidoglycan-associated protein/ABC-type amino acid transport substrate-binding protein